MIIEKYTSPYHHPFKKKQLIYSFICKNYDSGCKSDILTLIFILPSKSEFSNFFNIFKILIEIYDKVVKNDNNELKIFHDKLY